MNKPEQPLAGPANADRPIPRQNAAPGLLTQAEAATYLRTSVSYLEQLRVTGGGPSFKVLPSSKRKTPQQGKAVRYTKQALDSWIHNLPEFRDTAESKQARKIP
jgi:hypothetical protein